MNHTLFTNAQIVLEDKILQNSSLLVIDGKIADFGLIEQTSNISNIVDVQNKTIIPGLVDIQVHFRDPGQTHKEDLISGSKAAVSGGVTTVVCQPNTSPVLDSIAMLDYLYYKAKSESLCEIYSYACVTEGMKGLELTKIEDLASHKIVVGFTDDGLPVANSQIMRRAFEYSKITGKLIAQHAEDLSISNHGCINEGNISAKLGVRGIHRVSESSIVERDIALLRAFGGHYHVLHVSTKESLYAIKRAKMEGLNITAEVSPHHIFLTDEAVLNHKTNAKMNPPLRLIEDCTCLKEGLLDGTIDAIATDHAPHDYSSKNKPLEDATFGIIGVEHMLPLSLKLFHEGYISLEKLISKMSIQPAKIIQKSHEIGKICKGYKANLAIIDLNQEWEISKENIVSKSKNTPFIGTKCKGKVIQTYLSGKKVYDK